MTAVISGNLIGPEMQEIKHETQIGVPVIVKRHTHVELFTVEHVLAGQIHP